MLHWCMYPAGFRLLLQDMRETRRIQMKILSKDTPLRQLPYREMETFIMVS